MFLKSKFLGVALATCAALGISACDEASDAAKKALASVSIEQPLVSIESKAVEKTVTYFGITTGSGQYTTQHYIIVTSKDNETALENIIINRGNCGVKKYQINKQAYQNYAKSNPDYAFAGEGTRLATKSGELVKAKQGIFSDDKSLEFYNALEDNAKAIYELAPEFSGAKLPFDSSAIFYPNCKADSIIELELVANGGSFTYSFNQGY